VFVSLLLGFAFLDLAVCGHGVVWSVANSAFARVGFAVAVRLCIVCVDHIAGIHAEVLVAFFGRVELIGAVRIVRRRARNNHIHHERVVGTLSWSLNSAVFTAFIAVTFQEFEQRVDGRRARTARLVARL